MRLIAATTTLAVLLAAPALAQGAMPVCNAPEVQAMVKESAAGITPEAQAAKGDPATVAKIAAKITLNGIKELKSDAETRTCYVNADYMIGKENVFGDVGIEYLLASDPAAPTTVKLSITTVARQKK